MTRLESSAGSFSGLFVILVSSLFRDSSFVIRHFSHVRPC
jgi:hypothetical protein